MQKHERRQLEALLQELINIQDSVTHHNEAGEPELCKMNQRFRDTQIKGILAYVEGLTGGPE